VGKLKKLGGDEGQVRRIRKRTLIRWLAPGLSMVALTVSLVAVVRLDEEGRGLSSELRVLGEKAQIVSDHIVTESARVDSLTDLARIEVVATTIGLRRAVDAELVRVEENAVFDWK
jgi:hypothetical protein